MARLSTSTEHDYGKSKGAAFKHDYGKNESAAFKHIYGNASIN